jgi:hypothetical protein
MTQIMLENYAPETRIEIEAMRDAPLSQEYIDKMMDNLY